MRQSLIAHLKELIKEGEISDQNAKEILELYDLEIDFKDKEEHHAFDKAMQDIDNILQGQWE